MNFEYPYCLREGFFRLVTRLTIMVTNKDKPNAVGVRSSKQKKNKSKKDHLELETSNNCIVQETVIEKHVQRVWWSKTPLELYHFHQIPKYLQDSNRD